jgi:hypothetical protein
LIITALAKASWTSGDDIEVTDAEPADLRHLPYSARSGFWIGFPSDVRDGGPRSALGWIQGAALTPLEHRFVVDFVASEHLSPCGKTEARGLPVYLVSAVHPRHGVDAVDRACLIHPALAC